MYNTDKIDIQSVYRAEFTCKYLIKWKRQWNWRRRRMRSRRCKQWDKYGRVKSKLVKVSFSMVGSLIWIFNFINSIQITITAGDTSLKKNPISDICQFFFRLIHLSSSSFSLTQKTNRLVLAIIWNYIIMYLFFFLFLQLTIVSVDLFV